jgi:TrkA-C domain
MIAIASLLVVLLVSLIVTRLATVALIATGMSRETARFQARSAFTGTGFTTREAESVVNHPVRRRIVLTLMLAGNAGLVAVVASLMLGFTRGGQAAAGFRVLELVLGLAALFAVARSSWVDRQLSPLLARLLSRWSPLRIRDYAGLLELEQGYRVLELAIRPQDWAAGQSLGELALRDEGIVVLGIHRAQGTWVGAPAGGTQVRAGDTLVVYGREHAVCELDERRRGPAGNRAHERAVAAHLHAWAHELRDEGAAQMRAGARTD